MSGAGHDAPGRHLAVDDVELYVEDHGDGPPVVLIHGGLGSGAMWAPMLEPLTAALRVVVPDTRGHGRSTDVGAGLSYARVADDVAALIAALELADPVVGGWSDGGQVALELGVRHPGTAAALIVGAAYPDFAGSGLRDAHRALLGADDRGVPDLGRLDAQLGDHAAMIRSLHAGGDEQWRRLVEHTAPMWLEYAGLTTEQVQTIDVPVLVLAGDRDELVPLDLSVALHRALPDAELAVCPRAGHSGPMTPGRTEAFAALIADFAARHGAAGA
jgi:pimeloyl-ACP methyl ester carboxylesterase